MTIYKEEDPSKCKKSLSELINSHLKIKIINFKINWVKAQVD